MISYTIAIIMRIIILIIIAACLLSWFPHFDKRKEPLFTLNRLFNALVSPFRFVPTIGMVDISPIVAFLFYRITGEILISTLMRFGL